MFGILISRKLEKLYVASEFSEGVVRLSMAESKFKFWDFWEAPCEAAFGRELGRNPKLENLRLALKLVSVFAVGDGCKTGNVHLAALMILTDGLSEGIVKLCDLENLVGRLDFGPLLVS